MLLSGFLAERSVANTASSRLSSGTLFDLALGRLARALVRGAASTPAEDGHEEVTLVLENGLFEVRLDLLEELHVGSVPACQTAVIGESRRRRSANASKPWHTRFWAATQ